MMTLTPVLALDGVDLGDAALVAVFGEVGGEPGADDVAHLAGGDGAAPQREDVGAVVLAGVDGDFDGVAGGGAHAGDLVRRHGGADARAVDDDAEVGLALGDGARDRVREVGVIDRVRRVRAVVAHAVAQLGEQALQLLLQGEAAVVRADGDDSFGARAAARDAADQLDAALADDVGGERGEPRAFGDAQARARGQAPHVVLGDDALGRLVALVVLPGFGGFSAAAGA